MAESHQTFTAEVAGSEELAGAAGCITRGQRGEQQGETALRVTLEHRSLNTKARQDSPGTKLQSWSLKSEFLPFVISLLHGLGEVGHDVGCYNREDKQVGCCKSLTSETSPSMGSQSPNTAHPGATATRFSLTAHRSPGSKTSANSRC